MKLVDSDLEYGDTEDNGEANNDISENDDNFFNYQPTIDLKLVDRSFTNMGYIGFGEGIDLDALDNGGNW